MYIVDKNSLQAPRFTSNSLGCNAHLSQKRSKPLSRTILGVGASAHAIAFLAAGAAVSFPISSARAQSVVSACSGVSLPRSVVTDIAGEILVPVLAPVQTILGRLTLGTVNLGLAGSLANAAAGDPITLNALDINGNVIDVATNPNCVTQADAFQLDTPAGIAFGGNQITGLGTTGRLARAVETNAIAIGDAANTGAGATGAVAIGDTARVTHVGTLGSVALGQNSLASGVTLGDAAYLVGGTAQAEVNIGNRRITGVAGGSADTDAVNVAQLRAVTIAAGGDSLNFDPVANAYTAARGGVAQRITGVAAGTVGAGSTDAVNGTQLGATNDLVAGNTISITSIGGSVTTLNTNVAALQADALQYDAGLLAFDANRGGVAQRITGVAEGALGTGSTDAVNGAQLGATNDAVVLNTTNIANINTSVTGLQTDALLYDNGIQAFNAARGGVAQRVANIAAGSVGAGSLDAVNGGQLFGLGDSVASALGGSSAYDPATGTVTAGLDYAGTTYGSVQGAVSAIETSIVNTVGTNLRYFKANSVLADAQAVGTDSTAIGGNASATGYASTALGTGAVVSGLGSVAIGTGSAAAADGSVALGSASSTLRGASTGYTAFGLAAAQTTIGEVAIGRTLLYPDPITGVLQIAGERQITGVGAGSADTDAVNVAQLRGVSGVLGTAISSSLGGGSTYNAGTGAVTGPVYVINGNTYNSVGAALAGVGGQVNQVASNSVAYDTGARDLVTLGGANGTTVTNVAAGTLATGSTDAVNGGQLFATNQQVAANTSAITTLTNNVAGSTISPVQYSNPGTPTASNGGVVTNDVTLVGANAAAPVGLHNVADGVVAAGSTDAVNGRQLNGVTQTAQAAQATATEAVTLGRNSVQYDQGGASVSLTNVSGGPVALRNVAAGITATDAANVGQLSAGVDRAISTSNAYTDSRIGQITYDLKDVRRDASGGTAAAMAMATIPQAYGPGMGMAGMGVSTWRGESAIAFGVSKASADGRIVVKAAATYNTRGHGGAAGGVGFGF